MPGCVGVDIIQGRIANGRNGFERVDNRQAYQCSTSMSTKLTKNTSNGDLVGD